MHRLACAVMMVAAVGAGLAHADTLHVPGDYSTIQAAIDAATDGDEVVIADGTYTGDGNTDLDTLGKAITVRGASGDASACVIDCQRDARGFYVHSGETPATVIADLTVRNGWSAGAGGSAIRCWESGVTVQGCRLLDNRVSDHTPGGAVYGENSELVLADCVISGGCADTGGGIYAYDGRLTLERCSICRNRGYWAAGGVQAPPGSVITDCRIEHNSATDHAGILAREGSVIQGCVIRWNRTYDDGGAIRGGHYVNCVIAGNVSGAGPAAGEADLLVNCTVVGNRAEEGPVLKADQVANCIVWGNRPDQIDSSSTVTYSCVEGGWPGTGNIGDDPLLAFDEDYRLTLGSPCIGAGTNDPPGGLPAFDPDGNPRPLPADGFADMGVYEFNAAQPTIAVSSRELVTACPLGSGDPPPMALSIRNAGGSDLHWRLLAGCSWLSCDPPSGVSAGEVDEVTLEVSAGALPRGEHVCDLLATAPGAVNDPVHVAVTLRLTDTLHVPESYATIQAAVDDAVDGDRIELADDLYTGQGNVEVDLPGKDIVIEGASGDPAACVIDCGGGSYGLEFSPFQGPSVVLSGLTVTNSGYTGVRVGEDASPTITNCRFENNGYAGLYIGDRSNPVVSHCLMASNGSAGATVWNRAGPTFSNCTFRGNQESGLQLDQTCMCFAGLRTVRIYDSLFADNAATYGAGLDVSLMTSWVSVEVWNCTFHGNVATSSGGGLWSASYPQLLLENSAFWGNDAPTGPQLYLCGEWGGSADLAYCDVDGGLGGIYVDEGADLTWAGLMASDPLFADPDGGDYRLTADSPCVNAGDPDYVPPLDETDLDGHARVLCGRVDMGAYEFAIGDYDCDHIVDLTDFTNWDTCMTGPDGGPYEDGCNAFDFELDIDVDLADFAGFQNVFGT